MKTGIYTIHYNELKGETFRNSVLIITTRITLGEIPYAIAHCQAFDLQGNGDLLDTKMITSLTMGNGMGYPTVWPAACNAFLHATKKNSPLRVA